MCAAHPSVLTKMWRNLVLPRLVYTGVLKTIKLRQETNSVNFLPDQCQLVLLTAQLLFSLLSLFTCSDVQEDDDEMKYCSTVCGLPTGYKSYRTTIFPTCPPVSPSHPNKSHPSWWRWWTFEKWLVSQMDKLYLKCPFRQLLQNNISTLNEAKLDVCAISGTRDVRPDNYLWNAMMGKSNIQAIC